MSSRFNIALALVALAGIVATLWLILAGPVDAPRPAGLEPAAANAVERPVDDRVAVDAGERAMRSVTGRVGEGSTRSVVTGPLGRPRVPSVEDGLVVRCVDARTGEPVEGARLFRAVTIAGSHWLQRHRDPVGVLRDVGDEIAPDDRGRFVVSRPFHSTCFAALSGDRRAWCSIAAPTRENEVVLQLDRVRLLHVDIIDASGDPVGGMNVELRLESLSEDGGAPVVKKLDSPSVFVRSDALTGRATIDLLRFVEHESWQEADRFVASVRIVGAEPIEASFALPDIPAEPLEIRLPPCGRILVETTFEGESAPVSEAAQIVSTCSEAYTSRGFMKGNQVVFEHVVLGLHFRVLIGRMDELASGAAGYMTEHAGPMVAGEEVPIRVEVLGTLGRARLVDDAGSPIVNSRVGLTIGSRSSAVTSDPSGLVRFSVPRARSAFDGERLAVRFECRVGDPASPIRGTGHVRVPDGFDRDWRDGALFDMGEVVLLPVDGLVSGTVVDAEGNAVPDVRVLAMGLVDGERVEVSEGRSDMDGHYLLPWPPDLLLDADTVDLQLTAQAAGALTPQMVSCRVGDDVSLVVERMGWIQGRVAIDADGSSPPFWLKAVSHSAWSATSTHPWAPRIGGTQRVDPSTGDFEFSVSPGTWNLELWVRGHEDRWRRVRYEQMVAIHTGVVVEPSAVTRPAALDPWIGLGDERVISVVATDGAPIESGTVNFFHEGRHIGLDKIERGEITISGRLAPIDLWIESRDRAATLAHDVHEGMTVTMGDAPSLEVAFELPSGGLPEGRRVSARATFRPEMEGLAPRTVRPHRDADPLGPLRFGPLDAHGSWSVQPLLVRLNTDHAGVEIGEPTVVDVPTGRAEVSATITIDSADLLEAVIEMVDR